jgi:ADP-ribose pyrophosphatase
MAGVGACPGVDADHKRVGETMAVDEPVDIETTGTRVVCENKWMRVREDKIRRRDGSSGIYSVVEKPHFVVIVPVEGDGRLHLVQQFRYPVRGRYWELPQGSWEDAPEADPLEVARGELREETGLDAASITHVGHLFEACGYANRATTSFSPPGSSASTPTGNPRSKIS